MSGVGDVEAFYAEHYSDWTVHALSLVVYVPSTQSRGEALALVQEILDEAAFDIRVQEVEVATQIAAAEQRGREDERERIALAIENLPLEWLRSSPLIWNVSAADAAHIARDGGA